MLSLAAAVLIFATAPAVADDREIDRFVFELCPKVLEGSLKLDDPELLATTGMTLWFKSETSVMLTRGEGATLTRILHLPGPEGARSCTVAFVDTSDHRGFETLARTVADRGFRAIPVPGTAPAPRTLLFTVSDNPQRLLLLATGDGNSDSANMPVVVVQMIDKP